MADELTLKCSFSYTRYGHTVEEALPSTTFDVTGDELVGHVLDVDTAEQAIPLGDVATPSFFWIENLDSSATVEVRSGTGDGNGILSVPPGGVACGWFHGDITAPYILADANDTMVRIVIIQV